MTILYTRLRSPLGALLVLGNGHEVIGIHIEGQHRDPQIAADWTRADGRFEEERAQLDQYFAGRRRRFEVALRPLGTEFQHEVWSALGAIPFGATTTYGELARAIGRPRAQRAVGAAVGRNPISIMIPCHRVVGASGALTGYGGGISNKRRLLDLEAGSSSAGPQRRVVPDEDWS